MRNKIIYLLTAIFFLLSINHGSAHEIEYVSSTLWTGAKKVVVEGDYAYCAFMSGLMILNVSDSANPIVVAQEYFYKGTPTDIEISGNKVFIANSPQYTYLSAGILVIIDVSDVNSPDILGEFTSIGRIWDVEVNGDYACIVNYAGGLGIIDISDPANPFLIGNWSAPWGCESVEISGHYALVANEFLFRIIDVGNVRNPVLVSSLDIHYQLNPYYLKAYGQIAYVLLGGTYNLLYAIDISNPSNPIIRDYITVPNLNEVFVSYPYMFATTYGDDGNIVTIDISTPDSPQLLNELQIEGASNGIGGQRNNIFIANWDAGIKVMDISDPLNPSQVGQYETNTFIRDIVTHGNYAYTAHGRSGFSITDISDPYQPTEICRYDSVSAYGLYVNDNYLYVALGLWGIAIFDVFDPNSPQLRSLFNDDIYVSSVWVQDSLAYLSCIYGGNGYMRIWDLDDVDNPIHLSTVLAVDDAWEIKVQGDYAYVTYWEEWMYGLNWGGVEIFDVSEPSNPTSVWHHDTEGDAWFIDIENSVLVVNSFDTFGGMEIYNIIDPSSPSLIYRLPVHYGDICIIDNYIYTNRRWRGPLTVFDISNLESPIVVDSLWNESGDLLLSVMGDYIYAGGPYSLRIFHFETPTSVETGDLLPTEASISQNYPNPFNASTTLSYMLPEAGAVTISVYNLLGQRVATIFEGRQQAGQHIITWDAAAFPSGVYFARLEAAEYSKSIKMVLLK